jgi:uncharacterized protein involved in exopolysaccharide biosynthesis
MVSLVGLANVFLREWLKIVGIPILFAVLFVVAGALLRQHAATSRFAPIGTEAIPTRLAGIAAQFGFSVGAGGRGESVEFYIELARSRELLTEVALAEYRLAMDEEGTDSVSGTLVDIYGITGDSEREVLLSAVSALNGALVVRKDVEAGIVTLQTTAPWPELAEQINRRILDFINSFNLEKRQSKAKAERGFVEERMRQAQSELEEAESELEAFVNENRSYLPTSPTAFEAGRLQRRVDLRQQVFTTLAQAYEEARIEEVRNTPVLTIIDHPENSAESTTSLAALAFLGLVFGGVLAGIYVLAKEYVARERKRNPDDYLQFERLRSELFASIAPGRILGSRRGKVGSPK